MGGNNKGTLPEPVPTRDIAPSTTLSKATVDFSSAVVAFMRAFKLVPVLGPGQSNARTLFCFVTSVSCAARTYSDFQSSSLLEQVECGETHCLSS